MKKRTQEYAVKPEEVNCFIGKNHDKITESYRNIPAALFGPLWFLYRKCYKTSIITFFLQIVLGTLIYLLAGLIAYPYMLLWFIFYIVYASKIYRNHTEKQIKSIKAKHENYEDFILIKGGTSVVSVVIGTFLYSVIVILIIHIMSLNMRKVNTIGAMSFESPDWKETQIGSFYKEDKVKICMMQMGILNKTGKNLMYYFYNIKEDFSNLQTEEINGSKWYTNAKADRNKDFITIYLYEKNKDIYIAKFYAKETKDYNSCNKEFNRVKKSIRIK